MNFLSRYCAGSLPNAHLHFHVVMIDGVFCEEDAGRLHFLETCLSAEQMAHLQRTVRQRISVFTSLWRQQFRRAK